MSGVCPGDANAGGGKAERKNVTVPFMLDCRLARLGGRTSTLACGF